VSIAFFESEYGNRLDHLLELPEGKMIAAVDYTDAAGAKEVIGSHTCLMIFSPRSSRFWSLRELEKYAREMLDKYKKGGGIILNVKLPDKGTAPEYRKLLDSIRDYGRYWIRRTAIYLGKSITILHPTPPQNHSVKPNYSSAGSGRPFPRFYRGEQRIFKSFFYRL
jgi:hypothetical protein